MEHVVFFPGPDGSSVFRRVASLDEAVAFVETLRNDSGVAEVSVYRLEPVPLAFRTYYRVELPGSQDTRDPGVPLAGEPATMRRARREPSRDAGSVPAQPGGLFPPAPVEPAAGAPATTVPAAATVEPLAPVAAEAVAGEPAARSLGFFA